MPPKRAAARSPAKQAIAVKKTASKKTAAAANKAKPIKKTAPRKPAAPKKPTPAKGKGGGLAAKKERATKAKAPATAAKKTPPNTKAAAVVAKPPSGQWACFACTLFNGRATTVCEACGTQRGFTVGGGGSDEVQAEKYLEFSDGKSNKFWKLSIQGCTTIVTFGRIGTPGQTDTKVHNNEAAARKFADTIEAEKMRKGYA